MTGVSRRDFLSLSGSAAVAAMAGPANAAMGPNDKFDLVIKGGDVLDPSQSLRGKRDIGIRWGVIEAIENEIPAARASKAIDASGKLVTPGLIDLHCHVYPYGSAMRIPPHGLVAHPCPTTAGSAGAAGAQRAAPGGWGRREMPASTTLRHCAAISWRSRVREFLHSSTSPITGCRRSRSPSSTTSTTRKERPPRWRSATN